jgi:hypothetical protein
MRPKMRKGFSLSGAPTKLKESVMKNTIKILGTIAFVAVIGFTFAACDGDDDGGGDNTPYVPITQIPANYLNTTWVMSFGSAVFFDADPGKFQFTQGSGFGLKTFTVSPCTKDQIAEGFDSGLQPYEGSTAMAIVSFKKDGSKLHFARMTWTK